MRRHKFAIIAVSALIGLLWISNAPAQEQNLQIAQAPTTGLHPMTYADLEKLYLDGKISAKQYQKFLNEIKSRPVQPPVTVQPSPLPPAITPPPVNPPTVTVTPTTSLPPPVVQTSKDNQINAVESKMDELLRAKAAREK